MELAFREPIRNASGDVKYPAGVFMEWPRATFQQIANNVGKSLSEITMTKEEAGAALAGKSSSETSDKSKKKVTVKSKSRKKKSSSTKRVRMQE